MPPVAVIAADVQPAMLPLAAGDWLEVVLPFLFFIFWLVAQVVNVVRRIRGVDGVGKPGRPQAPPEVVREVRRPVPLPPRDPQEARAELDRQIEAFRRAQQEGAARGAPPPARPVPQRPAAEASRPPRRGPPAPPAPAPPRPASTRGPAAPRPRGAPLGGHSGEIGRHVDENFSHDLSHERRGLGASAAPTAPVVEARPAEGAGPSTTVAELITMLRDPATVRQAILLREVLDRPVDRW